MTHSASLRRLIDMAGIADLETKALMKPAYAAEEFRADYPEIDAACRANFGLTPDEADAVARPADWDGVDRLPVAEQVEAFEAEGWDVTDARGKPMRVLPLFALPLALAARGVAGALPFQAEPDHPSTDWGASLKADAARFRKR